MLVPNELKSTQNLNGTADNEASQRPGALTTWERGRAFPSRNAGEGDVYQRTIAPSTWERGRTLPSGKRKRRRRRRHRRRHKAKTQADLMVSAAAEFDAARGRSTAGSIVKPRAKVEGTSGRTGRLSTTAKAPPHRAASPRRGGAHAAARTGGVGRECQTADSDARRCTGVGATERSVVEGAPRPRIGKASANRGVAPLQTPGGSSHCCSVEEDRVSADGDAERRANNTAGDKGADGKAERHLGPHKAAATEHTGRQPLTMVAPAHRAASPRRGAT